MAATAPEPAFWDALEWEPSQAQRDQLVELQGLLQSWNERVNLTRLVNGDDFWIGQVFDSLWPLAGELQSADEPQHWIDVGTGGGFPGLAIATSTAAWINVILLFATLKRRDWYNPGPELLKRLVSVMLASSALGALLWYLASISGQISEVALDSKFVGAIVIALVGAAAYLVFAVLFGAIRLSDMKGALRR